MARLIIRSSLAASRWFFALFGNEGIKEAGGISSLGLQTTIERFSRCKLSQLGKKLARILGQRCSSSFISAFSIDEIPSFGLFAILDHCIDQRDESRYVALLAGPVHSRVLLE